MVKRVSIRGIPRDMRTDDLYCWEGLRRPKKEEIVEEPLPAVIAKGRSIASRGISKRRKRRKNE